MHGYVRWTTWVDRHPRPLSLLRRRNMILCKRHIYRMRMRITRDSQHRRRRPERWLGKWMHSRMGR